METKDYTAFGQSILEDAGAIALKYFRTSLVVDNKKTDGNFDPVTQGDKEVETFIRQEISARFPEHGIIGEEFEALNPASSIQWIIDPIDGTRAFMTGMTGWGILLGMISEGTPTIGFMHQPYIGETWVGTSTGTQFIRGGKYNNVSTRKNTGLDDAVLYSTHPEMFQEERSLKNFEELGRQVKLMRFGGDCYAYCMLAMGFIDIIVEDDLQPYDILPLMPIIEGAGGVVTNLAGHPPHKGGLVVTAATKELHGQALAIMNS
jgi:myo-inositol-1(or 4)-monophosphatase